MKVLITGGGACGASTAARLRRLDDSAEIIILEQTDEISIANCGLPYYCSDVIDSEDKMHVSSVEKFKNLLNVDIKLGAMVTSINRANKTVTVNGSEKLNYDKLVLATGAAPFKPQIKGIDNKKIFTVRTLRDANRIKSYIRNSMVKSAVVIGGGFIGVEMAENISEIDGVKTTLVEQASHILPPVDAETAAFAQNEIRKHGVELILSDGVKEFGENDIILQSGRKIPYDIAVLAIVASSTCAGIPGGGIITIALVLNGIGLTPEQMIVGFSFLFALDRFTDMMRTTANVVSDTVVAAIIADNANEINYELFNNPELQKEII